ncbi:nitrogen fixation protein NifM [Mangrovibacter yixingensis]|uniref:nitrogen fixation protein NifM n=1 Tax=Mangrovibacter yixingensis TaxID=1529639 RepID=UPI001CFB1034|nr:nitrogen fixation protein NifM [Mangrovibacter yixingensis]
MNTAQLPWQRFAALQLAKRHWNCLPEEITADQQSAFQAQLARQVTLEMAICRHYPADNTVGQLAALVRKEQADFMETHGFTHDEQLAVAAHQAHVTSVMNRIARKAPPPDDQEVVAWYQANAARFCRPAQRKARHILLTCDNDEDRSPERAQIAGIIQSISEDPESFADQALRFSHCPSAMDGGLLGWISPGLLYPELDSCLFSLEKGQLSEVVETVLGLHILLCEDIRPAEALDEAVALEKARAWLTEQTRKRYQQQWLSSLLTLPAAH